MSSFFTVRYDAGTLTLLDQTKLPTEETYVDLRALEDVARAIETMVVRGAPAIGITAAYGMAVAAREGLDLAAADARLRKTRPTAVNLFWALDRMQKVWAADADLAAIEAAGHAIYAEEV